tara:strand:+ start:130109 stop:132754 length:2646 start_codon:yes stop_codon:yes gene_type:complete
MAYGTKAQCDSEGILSLTICDMTTIDGNGDTVPDGIINLYDEYFNETGEVLDPGTWFDPNFDFVLDTATGDLNLWGLGNASEAGDDYTYLLYRAGCTDPILTLNIILGPFSGLALPATGPNSVNAQVCNTGDPCVDMEGYDLFEALQTTPSPHLNGTWVYEGSSPNFVQIIGSELFVDIPYQAGVGLIEETFQLTYVVPGTSDCIPEQRTNVNISVVRRPSSGESQPTRICEQDVIDGLYDADIQLSNDMYLLGEDLEGTWSGGTGTGTQITSPSDNTVNFKALYDGLMANNPRFGYAIFNFRYSVKKRSGVCFDSETDIPFILFEALRPFEQEEDLVICKDGTEPSSVNMMQELLFTTENGVTYTYLPGDAAEWEFVSGPGQPDFTPEGVLSISDLDPGTYIFNYTVSPSINCNGNCPSIPYLSNACPSNFGSTSPCAPEMAEVRILITEPLYAGEDTDETEICYDGTAVDLISLLETNGTPVYRGNSGIWTDGGGTTVPNEFAPTTVEGQQTFNLTYTTTNGSCTDEASLELTLYEEYLSGVGSSLEICSDTIPFDLFDLLTGAKNGNGTWSGPNGYTSTFLGNFDPATEVSGEYVYTVPSNGPCPQSQSVITVSVDPRPNAGPDLQLIVCRSETALDLYGILGETTDSDGVFTDLGTNLTVSQGILDLLDIEGTTIQLEYRVDRNDRCAMDLATINLQLTEVPVPEAADQNFCILEGASLEDVVVRSDLGYQWYASPNSDTALPVETVLQGTTYYVAAVDANGCQSERVPVAITVYNIGEVNSCRPDLPEGVSPNGDGQNDILDLGDLENAFPSFQLSIYNRYGTMVYKGKSGTPYFSGLSNVSPSLGNDLPAGVYFYVFEPNDDINGPFQDSFYLSK